jgi:hypothetical protein
MITKFRIEAKGESKEEVGDEILAAVSEISKVFRERNGMNGYWECTDDVISQERTPQTSNPALTEPTGTYRGRMVMTYRERY